MARKASVKVLLDGAEEAAVEAAAQSIGMATAAWARRVLVAWATGASDEVVELSMGRGGTGGTSGVSPTPVRHREGSPGVSSTPPAPREAPAPAGKIAKLFPPVTPTGPLLNGEPGTIDIAARQTDWRSVHERWSEKWWNDLLDQLTEAQLHDLSRNDSMAVITAEDIAGTPPFTDHQRKHAVLFAKRRVPAHVWRMK